MSIFRPPLTAMRPFSSDIAFTPSVKAIQIQKGSRTNYARMEQGGSWETTVTPELTAFLSELDMFYLGTANAEGQPYIQYRGGSPGFLRVVDEKTRELLQRTNRGQSEFSRVRAQIADSHGIKVGDEMLDYLLDQVVSMLMHSHSVEEVFAEDVELRRRMAPIFKKHMGVDSDVDAEVRAQLRHVKEGTAQWDVEYARVLETVRRRHGLS